MRIIIIVIAGCLFQTSFSVSAQNKVGINKPNPAHSLDVLGTISGTEVLSESGFSMNGYKILNQDNFGNTYVGNLNPGVAGGLASQYNTVVGAGACLFSNSISGNTVMGRLANYNNSFTNYSCVFGYEAFSNSYGSAFGTSSIAAQRSVAIGNEATAYQENSIAIGYRASISSPNSIRLGNNDITGIFAKVGLTITSDKRVKENFNTLNPETVLVQLAEIPVSSWNFKYDDSRKSRHYGPMAQDFFAAFGNDAYGTIGSDTTINTHDLASINTVAIQALEKRTQLIQQLKKENEALKTELSHLKSLLYSEIEKLQQTIDRLVVQSNN